MCNSNSLVTSTGYGLSMQFVLLGYVGMESTGDLLSRSDILKLVLTKLDSTNWNAWKIEIMLALRLHQVAHYVGADGGVYETLLH